MLNLGRRFGSDSGESTVRLDLRAMLEDVIHLVPAELCADQEGLLAHFLNVLEDATIEIVYQERGLGIEAPQLLPVLRGELVQARVKAIFSIYDHFRRRFSLPDCRRALDTARSRLRKDEEEDASGYAERLNNEAILILEERSDEPTPARKAA